MENGPYRMAMCTEKINKYLLVILMFNFFVFVLCLCETEINFETKCYDPTVSCACTGMREWYTA